MTPQQAPRGNVEAIVDGIRHALESDDEGRAEEIARLLCLVGGGELETLDAGLGALGEGVDLIGIVTKELDEPTRDRVLQHFDSVAPPRRGPRVRLVSDVDDTLFVSIHDRRYPRGTVYPGVRAFQRAVQAGPLGQDPTAEQTFVTARPSDGLGLLEGRLRSSLTEAGVEDPVVMSGDLASVVSLDARVERKLENLRLFLRIHNGARVVYMGDSAMGDTQVCLRLRAEAPEDFVAAFIHDISGTSPEERESHESAHVYFHDTYVGAGLAAHRLGLVTDEALDEICRAAREEFELVEWSSSEQEAAMRALLERDLAASTAREGRSRA